MDTPVTRSHAIGAVPEAWPLLLTRELVCAYVCMSADTFKRICPVPPISLDAKLLRWRKADIDDWIAGLPVRLAKGETAADNVPAPAQIAGEERRFSAVERAKQRSSRNTGKASWKTQKARSRSSNG